MTPVHQIEARPVLTTFSISSTSPLFANTSVNDYSLAVNSPARNAGDPSRANDPDGSRSDIGWRADRFGPRTAVYNTILSNGSVVGTMPIYGGYGYTNTPLVRLIGDGSGAQAVAAVNQGLVTAINIINAGAGYTNAPVAIIEPPFIPNPVLNIAPMSFLSFSNLTVSGNYQLQQFMGWFWTNQPVVFTATGDSYTQLVAGVQGSGDFRLTLNPAPVQAFATAQVINGFVVGASITAGGSGYFTSPTVNFIGGGGTNAVAIAKINSSGSVTNITMSNAGFGYTNIPTVQIAPPPAAALSPIVFPVMRVDASSLSPYDNYQFQFKPELNGIWENWNGVFSPTDTINSQYLFITNNIGFFRLQYVP